MENYTLKATEQDSSARLDVFLFKYLQDIGSRSFIQKLIISGKVCINNNQIIKPHHKVKPGDEISIEVTPQKYDTNVLPENIPLDIVFEDEDLLVINKPINMVVHPAPGNYSGTLVNALLFHYENLSDVNHPLRPGIVHRLDKDTSGLLVVAKNNYTHIGLAKQFQKHTIERKYIAIVKGVVQFNEDIIELPLGRDSRNREKIAVNFFNARDAKTKYKVIKRFENATLLELTPFTGRTHQLRVHLAHLGHPILGDLKYGGGKSGRMCLHAKSIAFLHPKKKELMKFDSQVPFNLEEL